MLFNKGKDKILFVVPSASINGAIVVLMNFLSWMKENKSDKYSIETIVQWGKDDSPDAFFRNRLAEYGKVTFLEELDNAGKSALKSRLLKEKISCVFYNSIISVETQRFLFELKAPQVFFVHEMTRLMRLFRLEDNMDLYVKPNTHFIACSRSVKQDLKKVLKVNDTDVTVIHEFINPKHIQAELDKLDKKTFPLSETFEPDSSFVVGFSGTFELRKSADLLPALSLEIKKRIRDVRIFWVGASPFNGEPGTYDMVMEDVRHAGLTNDIVFIPKGLGHYKYYNRFDVFVMLSREDPFPVVNIEMGHLGVPIICFQKSGGSQEYAAMGGGVAVPFMDLSAIADQVHFFYKNRNELKTYKEKTPEMVANNFVVNIQAPKIYDIICQVSSGK